MHELEKQQRLLEKRREAFGDALSLYDYRFERDSGTVPQMEKIRSYAESWDAMYRENMGLLLWGKPGSGKTFAAGCIANHLIEREGRRSAAVRMTTFGTILNRLPGMPLADKEHYLRGFQTCDLLILDDFGMERRTDYAREQVFHIIDSRYLARRPLIITTNLSLRELKNPVDMMDQRLYDRVLEMCVPVCFDGESQRRSRAGEKVRRFKELAMPSAEGGFRSPERVTFTRKGHAASVEQQSR